MLKRETRIRLLACDLDGTLFTGNLEISARVREAIATAQREGVQVILATGRMPAAAKPVIDLLGLEGPQIFYNGALVSDTSGETYFHLPVEPKVAQRVVAYTRASALHLNAYVGDTIYVERLDEEAEFTRKLNRVDPVLVGDLAAFLERAPTKLVVVRLPVVEDGLIPRLRQEFEGAVTVSSSVRQYCEMVNPAVDKGRALTALAERLGLSTNEVAAIGDGDNDATLLRAAGVSFAMGNGTPVLKALATHVVGSVEEDGAAEAIQRILSGDY